MNAVSSNFFNYFFSYYMIFNYIIQPIFMIAVVYFLVRVVKHTANIEKQNRVILGEIDSTKCIENTQKCIQENVQEGTDNQ